MGLPCEDTITLTVDWLNGASQHRGVAVYTASWIAPKSDVHSQQRFFYMGHAGEVTVDQAHRGYSVATDMLGYASPNPLFMSQIPDTRGYFAGQNGYGYRSIESFVAAAEAIKNHRASLGDFRCQLAMAEDTLVTTAILEAGRRSLDAGGKAIEIDYDASDTPVFRGR
jgi:D-galacturonate reductase